MRGKVSDRKSEGEVAGDEKMRNKIERKDMIEFKQEDGKLTAWLPNIEKKMELSHQGSQQYKRIFYLLFCLGITYLAFVFIFVK